MWLSAFGFARELCESGHQYRGITRLLPNLLSLLLNLSLLFFNRVEHRPDDGVVVDEQIALAVFRDRLRLSIRE
jgi:hypothetical protein